MTVTEWMAVCVVKAVVVISPLMIIVEEERQVDGRHGDEPVNGPNGR